MSKATPPVSSSARSRRASLVLGAARGTLSASIGAIVGALATFALSWQPASLRPEVLVTKPPREAATKVQGPAVAMLVHYEGEGRSLLIVGSDNLGYESYIVDWDTQIYVRPDWYGSGGNAKCFSTGGAAGRVQFVVSSNGNYNEVLFTRLGRAESLYYRLFESE